MKIKTNEYKFRRAAYARIQKWEKRIQKAGQASLRDLVNLGKDIARSIVPRGTTGWLYRSIKGKIVNGKNPRGAIYLSPQILPNDGIHRRKYTGNKKWKYVNFNLARWMHTSPRAQSHFKGRSEKEVKFMYTTYDRLRQRAGSIGSKNFRKIIGIK